MIPCNDCHRHLRPSEARCHFCGAEQRATPSQRPWSALVVAAAVLGTTACASDRPSKADEAGTTTTADTSTDTSGATLTDTGEATSEDSSASGSFYAAPEDVGEAPECDPWWQDCPEGEKCVPYSPLGAVWEDNKCVPVTGDGQPGDPCSWDGVVEATDDCNGDSVCWFVNDDWEGRCAAFCEGPAHEPSCPEGHSCFIHYQGTVNLCLDECDPFVDDCVEGTTCTWTGDQFGCYTDPGGLPVGATCDSLQACLSGDVCVAGDVLPECNSAACCTDLCSLTDALPDFGCNLPGTECVPFFEEGMVPAGYEDVGVCVALPP